MSRGLAAVLRELGRDELRAICRGSHPSRTPNPELYALSEEAQADDEDADVRRTSGTLTSPTEEVRQRNPPPGSAAAVFGAAFLPSPGLRRRRRRTRERTHLAPRSWPSLCE
jgi:hypothetical protein